MDSVATVFCLLMHVYNVYTGFLQADCFNHGVHGYTIVDNAYERFILLIAQDNKLTETILQL